MVFVGLVVKAAPAKPQQQVTLPSPPTLPKPKPKPFSLSVKPLQTLVAAVAAEQGQKIEKKRTHHDGPQSTMVSQAAGSVRCSSIAGNAKTKKAKVVVVGKGEKNERGDMGQASMKQAQQNSHLPTGSIPSGARPPPCSAWPGNVSGGIVSEGHSSAVAVLGKRKEGGCGGIEMKRAEKKMIPSFSLESSPSPPSSPVKNTNSFKLGSLRFEVAGVKFYKDNARNSFEGASVLLAREAGNRYDSNAMKIVRAQEHIQIGHVPRTIAAVLAPLLDSGRISFDDGKISKIQYASNPDAAPKLMEIFVTIKSVTNAAAADPALQNILARKVEELLKLIATPEVDLLPNTASRAPTPQMQKKAAIIAAEAAVSAQQSLQQQQKQQMAARQQAQEKHLMFHKQKLAFDALDTSLLLAQVDLEQLLTQFPSPIRWDAFAEILKTSIPVAEVCLQPWKITSIPLISSSIAFEWQPECDIKNAIAEADEQFDESLLDAQDICVLELVEIRAKLSEQHSVAVREERDAAVSRAQQIGRQKAGVNDAISAAKKERLHKMQNLLAACGQEWISTLHVFSSFDDDLSGIRLDACGLPV